MSRMKWWALLLVWWFISWSRGYAFNYTISTHGPFQSAQECEVVRAAIVTELTAGSGITVRPCFEAGQG